jgi:hypothetical protein
MRIDWRDISSTFLRSLNEWYLMYRQGTADLLPLSRACRAYFEASASLAFLVGVAKV